MTSIITHLKTDFDIYGNVQNIHVYASLIIVITILTGIVICSIKDRKTA